MTSCEMDDLCTGMTLLEMTPEEMEEYGEEMADLLENEIIKKLVAFKEANLKVYTFKPSRPRPEDDDEEDPEPSAKKPRN